MDESETYPECLRRPDAGGHVQTRTTKTEKRYRKRYDGMARTWCCRHQTAVVTPFELTVDIGYRAFGLRMNTLKQYHAVIRQHLRDLWDEQKIALTEIERIDTMLRQQTPMPKAAKAKGGHKTSSGRSKSVQPATLSALVSELLVRPTPIRRIAAALLEYGVGLATRPGEFLSMREDPIGRLWVRSAKYSETNRKGLQPARKLIVDNLDTVEIRELREIATLLLAERAEGATTATLLRRCQHAIREARKAVGGRSKRVTAYTVRHQARANMAAMGMAPEEVAVVMNHASAMTAQYHYAPARSAWRGSVDAKPPTVDPELVAMVRPGNKSRGWSAQSSLVPGQVRSLGT